MPNINPAVVDSSQALTGSFDIDQRALRTLNLSGTLVSESYNAMYFAYIPSGPGAGQIGTVEYKLDGNTVATLTLSYDLSGNIISVVRS